MNYARSISITNLTLPNDFKDGRRIFFRYATVTGLPKVVKMAYDSLYDSIDSTTASTLERLSNVKFIYKMADRRCN